MLCSASFFKPVYVENQPASTAASAKGDMVIHLFIVLFITFSYFAIGRCIHSAIFSYFAVKRPVSYFIIKELTVL